MRPRFQITEPDVLGPWFGSPLFVLVFVLFGGIKPGYEPVVRYVSEGELGEFGLIQTANFFVIGASLPAFSLGALARIR